MTIKSLSQNSFITCLHTPQGEQKSSKLPSFPPTMAIALNSLLPSDIALVNATLSAHIEGEYAAFSMLHPKNTLFSLVSRAAPTLKF